MAGIAEAGFDRILACSTIAIVSMQALPPGACHRVLSPLQLACQTKAGPTGMLTDERLGPGQVAAITRPRSKSAGADDGGLHGLYPGDPVRR